MTDPPLHDTAARRLLPWGTHRLVPRGPLGQTVARAISLGLVDHIALRSAAIDEALSASSFPQVVLLGAGLDARAYRLPSLAGADVFEVDHPASQAAKVARVRELAPMCRSIRHVAVDFSRDELGASLEAAGHDAASPTAWVLEGVTMYLAAGATTALLDVVRSRSAAGSMLAMTYMRPPDRPLPRVVRLTGDLLLGQVGEPLGAMFTPDEVAMHLRDAGLEPRSDTCAVEWSERFGASAAMARIFRAERLVIAWVRE